MNWPNNQPEKICVLAPNKRFFGAIIAMIPFFYNLKSIFPGAHITVISPRQEISLLDELGIIDEIKIKGISKECETFISTLKFIKNQGFDMMFTLRRKSERDWMLNYLSGISIRVGFTRKWSPLVFNYKSVYDKKTYRAENFLKLLRHFKSDGIEFKELYPDYTCKTLPSVWLIPCGSKNEKLWPIKNYINLAEKIIIELNKNVVFVLGRMEKKYKSNIIDKLGSYAENIDFLDGPPNVIDLLGEVNNCIASVSNDCGPGHIPQISGKLSLILFNRKCRDKYEWLNRSGRSVEIVSEKDDIESISVVETYKLIANEV